MTDRAKKPVAFEPGKVLVPGENGEPVEQDVNRVQIMHGGELLELNAGERFETADERVIQLLDAHDHVRRVKGKA